MREIFTNISSSRKQEIKDRIDFIFDLFSDGDNPLELPERLNEYVNLLNIDEQDFADFIISIKFREEEKNENNFY